MKMREEGYFIAKEFRARGARRSYSSFILFAFDGNARARAEWSQDLAGNGSEVLPTFCFRERPYMERHVLCQADEVAM